MDKKLPYEIEDINLEVNVLTGTILALSEAMLNGNYDAGEYEWVFHSIYRTAIGISESLTEIENKLLERLKNEKMKQEEDIHE